MPENLFDNVDKLCQSQEAFAFSSEADSLFLEAMRENYRFQWERQPYIRHLGERAAFSPEKLGAYEDVFRIPPIFVGVMKLNRFCSIPESDVVLTLTSSGTTGQRSQILFDASSLARLQGVCGPIYGALGYRSEIPAHYLLFSYSRDKATDVGTSWSTEQEMSHAPVKSAHWLISWDGAKGDYSFDAGSVARLIVELSSDAPIRMIGFPAFMHLALEEVKRIKPGLTVLGESLVLAGGGWKNHAGQPMSHSQFCDYVTEAIGLPRGRVRDGYGMVEHGIPYQACSEAHHHAPVYSRLKVIDPISMEPKGCGEEGLLQLLTPYNTAQPSLSVLSTDVAVLGRDCPCGTRGDYLASIRRGGTSKHKGCAVAAQEILDRIKGGAK